MALTKQRDTPEKTYRQILLDSRKQQLRLTATAVRRLEITFDAAVQSIMQKIEALPAERIGTPWHRAQLQLLVDIRTVTESLGKDYTTLLEAGMVELAQNAAEREAAAAALVNAPVDSNLLASLSEPFNLTNGQSVTVQFGRLALGAVERVSTRYYRDGLKLSDRIHRLSASGRKVAEDTIAQGITEGISARDMAKRLQAAMGEASQDGKPPTRHQAMRIARTEIRAAHIESSIQAVQQSPGVLKPYVSGLRFNLSMSHPSADVCDLYATRDAGMGPGIYKPLEFPVSHPHCLCFSTSVLVAMPESGLGGKTPDPDNVPDSQRRQFNQEFAHPEMAGVA